MEQSGTIEYSIVEYGTKLDSIEVRHLQAGDFLHLKTKRGTRYVFMVYLIDGDKKFIRCLHGRPILVNSAGQIRNDRIEKKVPLIYGTSNGFNQTSSIREIIIRQDGEPKIAPKEYDVPLNELEVSTLEPEDYLIVRTQNSTYVFKVTSFDDSSGMPFVNIVGGNNKFLRQKGRILNGVIELNHPINTETVDTSTVQSIIVSKNYNVELPEPPNPFGDFQPSMPHIRVPESIPEVSKKIQSPYFVTQQELVTALGIENEKLTKATLEAAWLYFEHEFAKHFQTLGMVERIRENLRLERLKMGYEALMQKLDE